ncbi:MAG: cysteine desulfurase family protein [Bryobacteraceae bacterium]
MASLYFDHNATTPLAPEVAETYASALREVFGNASSVHATGQLAKRRLEQARRTIAEFINSAPGELVFTSGGTESNNLAILGLLHALPKGPKHVVASAVEHPAVLETVRQLDREGVDVSFASVGADGIVRTETIERLMRPETILVSVMHANNEVGTIQPIEEIARLAHDHRAYFHSDGVQALGKVDVDLRRLGVDLYSMSAHKVFAPKGVGALFVRKGVPFRGVQTGGHHERERRAGTENVPGIIAFAHALELHPHRKDVGSIRDRFEAQTSGEANGDRLRRLPNTSNLLFRGVSGEAMVIALDMRGMAASSGAACSSGSIEPSHVLLAMGRTVTEARSSVRFSFGSANTLEDADRLSTAVNECVGKLRKEAQLVAV